MPLNLGLLLSLLSYARSFHVRTTAFSSVHTSHCAKNDQKWRIMYSENHYLDAFYDL